MSSEKPLPNAPPTTTPPAAAPAPSQPKVHDTAHVADKASLVLGHALSIGAQCVLHPFAKVDASHAPVTIAEQCVLWEKTVVGAAPADGADGNGAVTEVGKLVTISPHVIVEAGAQIGDGVTLGPLSRVGAGAQIGAGASVAATVYVPAGTKIPAGAVLGAGGRIVRRRASSNLNDSVQADLEKAREIKDVGEARHRALQRKLVKGQAGGTGRLG